MKLKHLENFPPTTGFEPGTSRTPGEDSNPLPQSPLKAEPTVVICLFASQIHYELCLRSAQEYI